ncbi:MAG: ABC transporter ATP-binding protein [Spirochaetia bacterium]
MIEVKSIKKSFGDLTAVSEVSFTANRNEIFGLIGPNGAGKSTTIRMIMNILAPDEGQILFDGNPIKEKDKERIGYLPEERGLYKKVKVNEMLIYLAKLKNADIQESQKRIDYWLDRFDLMQWKEAKIEELSKGMGQKVQFIASMAHDPELIFLDEPFAGLDPVSSDQLRDSILDLGKQGKTILFSTHIMEHAEKICSNIFLINKGREVISGRLEDVKDTHGKKSVIIEFDGNSDFVRDLTMVKKVITYPRYMEIELTDDGDPDVLLKKMVDNVSVRKFEITTPSLHKIFVDRVGKKPEEISKEEEKK